MKTLNTLITNKSQSDIDDKDDKDDIDTKNCWSYTSDQEYNDTLNKQFLNSLIEKLKTETYINDFSINESNKSNIYTKV